MVATIECRLCGGDAEHQFDKLIMDKYNIGYFECRDCHSLETEPPTWLDEAYVHDVPEEDEWYLYRNLQVFANVKFICKTLKVSASDLVLDFGGGLGIVTRLLQEEGRNAKNYDTYATSPFQSIVWDEFETPILLTASELFEHLPNPRDDIAKMFRFGATYIYIRTSRYSKEGEDWFYLVPETGQHVFFYSDDAMRRIADTHGYNLLLIDGEQAVFYNRPISKLQKAALQIGLKRNFASRILMAKLVH